MGYNFDDDVPNDVLLLRLLEGLQHEHKRLSGHDFTWSPSGSCSACYAFEEVWRVLERRLRKSDEAQP